MFLLAEEQAFVLEQIISCSLPQILHSLSFHTAAYIAQFTVILILQLRG